MTARISVIQQTLTPRIYKGNKTLHGKKEDKIFNNIKES